MMATSWKSQQGDGKYYLQFETDDTDKYKIVEKASQMAIDGIADVEEVKHGEWILTKTEFGWNGSEYPAEYTCSVCGRKEEKEEPYCHCGAKMDGGGRV